MKRLEAMIIRSLFDPSRQIDRRIEKVIQYDTVDSELLKRDPGFGAERRFSAAELFSAIAVVVAGRDQGGVSRASQHR